MYVACLARFFLLPLTMWWQLLTKEGWGRMGEKQPAFKVTHTDMRLVALLLVNWRRVGDYSLAILT